MRCAAWPPPTGEQSSHSPPPGDGGHPNVHAAKTPPPNPPPRGGNHSPSPTPPGGGPPPPPRAPTSWGWADPPLELPRRGAIIRVIGYAAVIRVSASALDGSCHESVHSNLFGKFRAPTVFPLPGAWRCGPGGSPPALPRPETMGFLLTSFTWGFFPHTQTGKSGGQVHPLAKAARAFFTIRSSSEWKEITASRPPGFSRGTASRTIRSTEPSSSLTAMRMAWKVRLAGCCFSRRAAGGMPP